tara:strand:+ start:76 stop:306 length:231 start_codon:yes stop_codon:yes gene_type:complete
MRYSHGNLRPSNVLLSLGNNGVDVQLLDFSFSFKSKDPLPNFGNNKDQMTYYPPEIIKQTLKLRNEGKSKYFRTTQ